MTVARFVSELETLGVTLWEESGELRFRAPRGIVTGALLERLQNEKDLVLDYVRLDRLPAVVSHLAERHDPFPLTDIQTAYLLGRGTAYAYGGTSCHAYGEIEFEMLDGIRLQRAWNQLIERHDMLRSVISSDGVQRVLPDVSQYAIAVTDLRSGTPAHLAESLDATRHALDHKIHAIGTWPMFELRITLGDGRAILHVSIDFLIADYVSIQLLLRELRQLYTDPRAVLPPIGLTFRDYQSAERRLRDGPIYRRARAYWWSRIDDLPGAPELPTLLQLPEGGVANFRRWKTVLSAQRWSELQRVVRELGITASVAILSAYAEVIRRWSRNPTFLLNVTLLHRLPLHRDVQNVVGDFTSVLPLVVDDEHDCSFASRASHLHSCLLEAMDHRWCSGIEVMREVARRRGPDAAFSPVVFTSAVGAMGAETEAAGAFGRLGYGISQTPQVWIDCQVMEREGALHVNWDVREHVFPAGVIDDMFTAFDELLHKLANDAQIWTSLSPCSAPETQLKRRALVNSTAAPLPSGLLHDAFVEQAIREPTRVAIHFAGRSVNYAELLAHSRSIASALIQAGCDGNELVGILLDRRPEQIAAVMGALMAGAAYVPIDAYQPAARASSILRNARCRYLITDSVLMASLGELPDVTCLTLDTLQPSRTLQSIPRSGHGDEPAYVIHTSGSTGMPKGVMITHRSALNTVLDVCGRFSVRASDRVLALSNLSFDLSVFDIFGLLGCGGAIVMPDPERAADPSHWARLVRDFGITIWNSVPAQLEMLQGLPSTERVEPLASLRVVLLSGDWISTTLRARVRPQIPNAEFVSLGGATEAAIWSIFFPIHSVPPDWRSIPYGKPLANQRFHVLDRRMRHRPDWVPGELYISGAGLALGYLGDPKSTAERFVTHPGTGERLYRTGDFGRYLPDGSIEFLGREDSQVKIRGHRIELAEVESTLDAHPAVAASAVIAYGTPPIDRRLAAFAVPARALEEAADPQSHARAMENLAVVTSAAILSAGDIEVYLAQMRQLDALALDSMLHALSETGFFAEQTTGSDIATRLMRSDVLPKYGRLVRRWIATLTAHHFVSINGAAAPEVSRHVTEADIRSAWERLPEVSLDLQPAAVLEYFRASATALPQVLRGKTDPLQLLFPAGATRFTRGLYEQALFNKWANALAASAARLIAQGFSDMHRPLRVLELGAGQGGTTHCILESLGSTPFEYVITDVSPFFLNACRERFANREGLRYQTFDINQDFRLQGLAANSFDLIVAADIVHNARDVDKALSSIRTLLGARGWLLLLEMTRDHGQIMTSLELLNGLPDGEDFADLRRGRDQLFLTGDQWLALLTAHKASTIACLDQSSPALTELGMKVFAACFKTDRSRIDADMLRNFIRSRLPEYMLPAHLELIDELPLTRNGKTDRKVLESWLPDRTASSAAAASTSAGYQSDLQRRIAGIWGSVLSRHDIPPDANFFALGGDSLLAAQLATRLIEELPEASGRFFDEVLRSVLGEPTVAQLATVLNMPIAVETNLQIPATQSPLIVLRDTGSQAPLIFVHEADGSLAGYGDLLQSADCDERILGLVVTDLHSYLQIEPERLIETVASRYVRAVQNAGISQVNLVGCRFGGLMAAEVARQLTESGVEVRSLTTISSLPTMLPSDDTLIAEYVFAIGLGVDPIAVGFPPEPLAERALAALRDGATEDPMVLFAKSADRALVAEAARGLNAMNERPKSERMRDIAAALPSLVAGETIEYRYRAFLHSLRAARTHRASLFGGDLTVAIPALASPLCPGYAGELLQFWSSITLGEIRTLEVPCGPFDCLRSDCLRLVSSSLRAA